MKLTPHAQKALECWVGPSTWQAPHPADRERFYDFVRAFWESTRTLPDAAELRETIQHAIEKVHPGTARRTESQHFVTQRMDVATEIIEYLLRAAHAR